MSAARITKSDAIKAYGGNASRLAKALGVTRQAVHKIPDGPLPERWELKLRFVLLPEVFGMLPVATAEPSPAATAQEAA